MKKTLVLMAVGALVAAMAIARESSQSGAQSGNMQGSQSGMQGASGQTTSQDQGIQLADKIIGTAVYSSDNKRVGKVEDIVLSADRSDIAYLAVASGGFLGMGEKLVAIPVDAVGSSTSDRITLDIDQQTITRAPGFDRDAWPAEADDRLAQEVSSFYGRESSRYRESMSRRQQGGAAGATQSRQASLQRRASHLIGMKVRDPQNKDIGEIKDLVVDLQEGKVALAVLSLQDMDQLSAVPWRSINFTPGLNAVSLDLDRSRMSQIAVDSRNLQQVTSRDFVQRVYSTFGEQPYWGTYGFAGEEGQSRQQQRDMQKQQKQQHQQQQQQRDWDRSQERDMQRGSGSGASGSGASGSTGGSSSDSGSY